MNIDLKPFRELIEKKQKGQISIQGVLIGFVTLVVTVMLTPIMYTFIGYLKANASAAGDNTTVMLADLIVPMIYLGNLLIPVVYTIFSNRGQSQEG
jgi:heme/copper-type cytochrome/quinol oxidase subunit 2